MESYFIYPQTLNRIDAMYQESFIVETSYEHNYTNGKHKYSPLLKYYFSQMPVYVMDKIAKLGKPENWEKAEVVHQKDVESYVRWQETRDFEVRNYQGHLYCIMIGGVWD